MGRVPWAPLMSPVFADLSGLPPLLVLVGEDELLLDDARRLVDSARRSGTDARLLVGERMQHDWPLTLPWLEESRAAWKEMRRFVDERGGHGRTKAGSSIARDVHSGGAVTGLQRVGVPPGISTE
jgi:epsilon-lactone hydrolase